MTYTRRTLATVVRFEGLGLHSGAPVRMTVHPSSEGIAFRLGKDRIAACPENVTDTTRCTKLGVVSTVEHVMSAFAGLEITDAEVELDAPEVPGMDGSARPYVEAFTAAGSESIGPAERPGLFRRVFYQEGETKIAAAKGGGHWRYTYEAGARWPGTQSYEVLSIADRYAPEIAGARTFALSEELPMIMKLGLGRGLNTDSALILGPAGYDNVARYADEPARHKLLDLAGDLYLAGIPLRFLDVSAERSGHSANVKAAAMLKQATTP